MASLLGPMVLLRTGGSRWPASTPKAGAFPYHSGFVGTATEKAYDASAKSDGIDTVIASLQKHQVQPNSNVYAELGST